MADVTGMVGIVGKIAHRTGSETFGVSQSTVVIKPGLISTRCCTGRTIRCQIIASLAFGITQNTDSRVMSISITG